MRSGRRIMEYIATAFGVYAILIVALFFMQRSLLYHPNQAVPDSAGYRVPEMAAVRVPTEDGFDLLGWWREPRDETQPAIAYFHGNSGHIGDRADKVRDYLDAGYGVLLLSYRYNAGSGGNPSEDGLIADARAGLAFLKGAGIADERIVLYGESLGSGAAVAVAAAQTIGALVLEAPYSNMSELAQYHYWYTPARWLVRDTLDSASRISKVTAPILVIHGERDRVIPPKFARMLFDAAPEPKEAHFLPEGQHNDLLDYGLARLVIDFLDRRLK
ncbi:MAG: prolyl oligopeptidase family serine peptidase [Alphaproteobacteria bacterium]|nr:prolyl oligopeptidase family serine peptidase [Alphaproteobacteria bacterium]